MSAPSAVEKIKAASRGLRGTLRESLADPLTGSLREDDQQLIKLHGSYQQDDRDVREERRLQKLEPAWSFMLRTRLPGGVCTPAQWLALDALARTHGNGTLRLTTRQAFQLHGVLKRDLKATIQAINQAALDTIAACGDVNRNVMSSTHAVESAAHVEVAEWARRLSEHLLPKTRAYHEIWLDGEPLVGPPEEEPILGQNYLPRKFKTAVVVPPVNDVDVFSQDLGFIAIIEDGRLAGFNLTVGGGLGMSHGEPATFPRLADVVGFLPAQRVLEVAAAVVTIQRDFGDRSNRKHARLKYTIADRGLEWFRGELAQRLGGELAPPRSFEFTRSGDRLGWQRGHDGRWHLTLRIPAGRIGDRDGAPWLSGLREIARVHQGDFRLTPNQNLTIAFVPEEQRPAIDALVAAHGLDLYRRATPLQRDALACVALPTCALAMADAERYLPALLDAVGALMHRHGLDGEPLQLRITGCPNGCARPQLAEIALIGKAPGRYNLYVGGSERGTRLNALHRENLGESAILGEIDVLLDAWAHERREGERFGDFVWRSGRVGATDGESRP
ncbi:MAG: assimilatory sulfite reductase (NADPH) hemoprotein subunit [Steroidobacteraceae bacterium]